MRIAVCDDQPGALKEMEELLLQKHLYKMEQLWYQELASVRLELDQRLQEIHKYLKIGQSDAASRGIDQVQKTLDATRTTVLLPRSLKIDDFHLYSIFSNLADNAIETVGELPERERRIILHAELKNLYLIVKIENPSTRSRAERATRPGHGYGTQVLESIAKEYEGVYPKGNEDGVYRVMVAAQP